jgi:two-component system sensor histidine kinase YesM
VDRQNNWVHLIIEDNGAGMDAAMVSQAMLKPPVSKKGYALNNIVNRLNLFYGEEARIELRSSPGKGSRTDIWIPIREGDVES